MDNGLRKDDLIHQLEIWQQRLRNQRAEETNLRAQEASLMSEPQFGSKNPRDLHKSLKKFLPAHLMPGNVGPLLGIIWPFWYQMNFDLGADPTLDALTKQIQSFQVSQEAGLLLMSISRNFESETTSGSLGPYQMEIKDRQSSRQFSSSPVPVQMLGFKSCPTIFPTPMLLMPNAFLDVTLSSFQTVSQATTGSGKLQLDFFGYRIRIEDFNKMLATAY